MGEDSTELRIPLTCGHVLFAREVVRQSPSSRPSLETELPLASVGSGSRPTIGGVVILVVHGGPGLADHTESYSGLKCALDYLSLCHAVFFYDQLGCGASDKPKTEDFDYSLAYYVEELSQMVSFVQDRHAQCRICLLGHSWGGQVALEYTTTRHQNIPPQCAGVVISNAPLDEVAYEQKQRELRASLDPDVRQFLEQDEAAQAMDGSVGSAIYSHLIGRSETDITGKMKGWSILHRLGDVQVPCLFVTGTEDTIPWDQYERVAHQGHSAKIIQGAGHGPFFGPMAKEYFRVLDNFLRTIAL